MITKQTQFINGLPPRMRRPDIWANLLSDLMDFLSLGALFITGEVRPWPFILASAFIVLRKIIRFRFRAPYMVIGFLMIGFLGFQLYIRLLLPPVVTVAYIAPIALAWIGFARGSDDLWGWRMGLGFISLILASALSPDFSVTLFIIAFIVSCSIGVSCRYLSFEFTRRGTLAALPIGFIRSSFYQSMILIFIALLIFPLIPRMHGSGNGLGSGNDPKQTGYTEDISLNKWYRVNGSGSNQVALRIYGPNGGDPNEFIYGGLLRTRALDILTPEKWDSTVSRRPEGSDDDETDTTKLPRLMIVREMIGPDRLPIPYGTQLTSVEMGGVQWSAEKTVYNEWREGRARNQKFNYFVSIDLKRELMPTDSPKKSNSHVPPAFHTKLLKGLIEKEFKNLKGTGSKVRALENYFKKNEFKAVYAEDVEGEEIQTKSKLTPIERFLFIEKNGHCELFASSYAILLRMMGVPTRLISGFRVVRNSVGDVLTVRQADAHAWLEAYVVEQKRWVPIDPTPRILHTALFTDWVRDSYEWASAKWAQYILNYGSGENTLHGKWEAAKKLVKNLSSGKNPLRSDNTDTNVYFFLTIFIGVSALFSSFAVIFLRRFMNRKKEFQLDSLRLRLLKERSQIEKLREQLKSNPSSLSKIDSWMKNYEPLRFGDLKILNSESVTKLRNERIRLERELRSS